MDSVAFALRCSLTVGIALWLAFWLELDNAYWVLINTGLLLQPMAGPAVVKCIARIVGTVVAAAMT